MGKIIDKIKDFYPYGKYSRVDKSLIWIKTYCVMHPTCDNCKFRVKHEGCLFRGKSPREW